jgi:pentatricopeptide repeat protein
MARAVFEAGSSFGTAAGGGDDVLSEDEVTLRDVTRKLVDCRRRKAAANAVDLLVSLGRAGIEPDLFAATTCLGACVASGKQDLALKVFEEVFQKGVVKPDEVVFAELIRGHLATVPPAWPRAIALLNRMRTEHGVEPTALSYNLLLAKCADDNELERAEELVDRMADEEISPDAFTIEAVKKRRSIRSYAKKMLMF